MCVLTSCMCMCMCVSPPQAVQLVPALPTRLLPMLVQNMPHKLRDRSAQCLYLSAVIALCEGKVGPALREGLLSGLVEHLLSIDADIRWEDIVDAPTGTRACAPTAAAAAVRHTRLCVRLLEQGSLGVCRHWQACLTA